jgi:NAD(P)-dependent dehydrogenase (short-subunit alcohol dehydrogenase family)
MAKDHLDIDLSGRTAIVTGGSRGIGRAISLALAQAGANVVVAARTVDDSQTLPGTIHKTVQEIINSGGSALPLPCDVTSSSDVAAMVKKAIETYGTIDILVNNAGVLHGARFMDTKLEDFENIWRVNVLGTFLCTQAVLPHMIERKKGSIISVSSGLADSTHPGNSTYAATKAALNRMMIKLAEEVAEHNIAVNLLYPGMVRSEGIVARVRSDVVDRLPSPDITGPPTVWLAAQDASGSTGKINIVSTFGTEWP